MIFYADDDLDDVHFFSEIAASLGRKVLGFENGEKLMHQLQNPPPKAGIIFLDVNMPVMSGMETLQEIRAAHLWDNIPVVMLSTSDNPDTIQMSMKEGANLYLRKPAQFDRLAALIDFALQIDWKKYGGAPTDFYHA